MLLKGIRKEMIFKEIKALSEVTNCKEEEEVLEERVLILAFIRAKSIW